MNGYLVIHARTRRVTRRRIPTRIPPLINWMTARAGKAVGSGVAGANGREAFARDPGPRLRERGKLERFPQ